MRDLKKKKKNLKFNKVKLVISSSAHECNSITKITNRKIRTEQRLERIQLQKQRTHEDRNPKREKREDPSHRESEI